MALVGRKWQLRENMLDKFLLDKQEFVTDLLLKKKVLFYQILHSKATV